MSSSAEGRKKEPEQVISPLFTWKNERVSWIGSLPNLFASGTFRIIFQMKQMENLFHEAKLHCD